jgi:hypothetical protein
MLSAGFSKTESPPGVDDRDRSGAIRGVAVDDRRRS